MTPISGTSAAAGAARQGSGVSPRPQVQSRRVSLRLGPLGITYSTDQVVWSDEAAETAGADGRTGSPVAAGAEAQPVDAAAALAAQDARQPTATARAAWSVAGFDAELDQARRSLDERHATQRTYDRTGALRGPSEASQAAAATTGTAEPSATSAAATSTAAPGGGSSARAEDARRPSALRMRQALGAYLACARAAAAGPSMLNALA